MSRRGKRQMRLIDAHLQTQMHAITLARVWSICIEHGLHKQPEKLLELATQVQEADSE
jgi:hypothetical protein